MKPLTKNKIFKKKFIGDELSGAMNGFFNTVSMNKDSITGMIIEAIRPAKVGTDVIYYSAPDKDKTEVHLQAVYRFERTIELLEKLEEKGLLVKTSDLKSALKLFLSKFPHPEDNPQDDYVHEQINKCFLAFKSKELKNK